MKDIVTYENVMDCKKCNNSGWVITRRDKNGDFGGGRCDCHSQRMAFIAIEKSGLKESFAIYRFNNFECRENFQTDMYNTCQKFLNQDKEGKKEFLFLGGQKGSGKTHVGTATCRALIGRGKKLFYVTHLSLMNEFKANINSEEYTDVLSKYSDVDVLYIDDFMKFEPTKSDIAHSFELINRRTVSGKTTIITSERMLDEIIEIDSALGGRIKQRCGMFVISIARKPGRDWRLKDVG